jgi:hypothetical protein
MGYAGGMPRPRYHAAVSLGLAALVAAQPRRWRDALPVLAAGVLVDLDHRVDLAVSRRGGRPGYIILPLHAWEWVCGLLAWRSRVTLGLGAGLATHLALDPLNLVIRHPLFYWLTVRAAHRFRAREPLVAAERYRESAKWMFEGPGHWF